MVTGICRICGVQKEGDVFSSWVKDTFTNYDLLIPGEIICADCLFWFDQHSTILQGKMGKDKPQKMQNYSHFIIGGVWEPVSKGNKARMTELLLGEQFPEMASIAVSGQKHVAFRARRNPAGQLSGWVQFEETPIWIEQDKFRGLLAVIEELYSGFSKAEIETGKYFPPRIIKFGMDRWQILEKQIQPIRTTVIFQLALFLAQRSEDGNEQGDGSGAPGDYLSGDSWGLQESLSDDNLGAIRERNSLSGVHVQSGEIYQLDLFPSAGEPGQTG